MPKLGYLNMLVLTGGREPSEADFARLLRTVGFELQRIVPTGSAMSVLEARPVSWAPTAGRQRGTRSDSMVDRPTLDGIIDFHGHMCAGLALGIRAAEVALDQIGAHSADEEVVAIVETDMCGVDAVQFMTGCTFGKGNLVHRDFGKNAYTFIRRSDGRAIRVSPKPRSALRDPEWYGLFAKVRAGTADQDEREEFRRIQQERSREVLEAPLDELYDVAEIDVPAPPPARILVSVECASCGEPTMETRIRRLDGRELCLPCFEQELSGSVRLAAPTPSHKEAR